MSPTFELTIQRCLEFDVFPVVVELTLPGQALPLRSEGRLTLSAVDLEELATRTRAADYGAYLGSALFQGEILRAFDRAVAQIGGRMNVLLSVEAPELRALHWEWLGIPVDGGFRQIAQDQRFPYCLFQPSQVDRRFPPFGRRDLRMLVVVASPSGLEKYNLESFDEARALETVAGALGDKVSYDVLADREDLPRRIGPPSLGQLCERLTAKRYTLLHIIAHGRFNREGETILYLGSDAGEVQAVPAKEFLSRLAQLATLPHFIFLAVCESAKPEAEAALGGLGQRLVRELGVPAVLAMTRKVSHYLAYELTRRLYPQLLEHGEVERALVDACAGLIGQTDVSVPALYSRLGGRPLFSDDLAGRELTGNEIVYGLDRMLELFADRAPVMLPRLTELVNQARAPLGLSPRATPRPVAAASGPPGEPRSPTAGAGPAAAGGKFRSTARVVEAAAAGGRFQKSRTRTGALLTDLATLGKEARQEQQRTLAELETLSLQVLDLGFTAVALDKKIPAYSGQCPFPGMRAFNVDDQRYFFGREALIEALLRRLREHPFLAVLGASGSGKSSVVRAGLLPRLLRDRPSLQIITMIPGADPYSQLEAALERAGLREDPKPARPAILFVDQFEELFTLCPREKRALFLQRLLKLQPAIPLILTMRADFWGECAEHAELRRLMQTHQELVAAMTGYELRSAIEQQARAVGLRFEPSLCEKIVEHVQSEPGAMPLLQHALLKLWERRHGVWLSAAEYESLGGVQRAIAETADSIYHGLAEEDRARMRTVFVRLTRVDDGAAGGEARRDTRQRVAKKDLIPAGADSAPYVALIAHLADARLLVTNISPSTQQEEVEVVHEALIRHWPRLTQWLEEQRDSLALREALNKAAREWKKHRANRQWLVHSGSRLRECDELVKRFPGLFNQVEQDYLTACRSQLQRARLSWAGLFLAFLGSVGGISALAISTRRDNQRGGTRLIAETQAKQWAQSRQAGSLATLLALEPGTRLRSLDQGILAVAPFFKQRATPPGAALAGLRDGLMVAAFVGPLIPAHAAAVTGVAVSPDGALLASIGNDRQLRLFDAKSGALQRSVSSGAVTLSALGFSPGGEHLYAAGGDGLVQRYDRSGQLVDTLEGAAPVVLALALSHDGTLLATGGAQGQIQLFDLATRKLKGQLGGHKGSVLALSFTADSAQLISGGQDGTLRFWELGQKRPRAHVVAAHRGAVSAVVLAPSGTAVISAGEDGQVHQWNLADGAPLRQSLAVGSAVNALAVSRDGLLAVGDSEGATTLWRLGVRAPLWVVKDEPLSKAAAAISGLAFARESAQLITASTDGLLRVWNLPRTPVVNHLPDHEAPVTVVDFSPDMRKCLTAANDPSLRIYDVASSSLRHELRELDSAVLAAAFAPADEVQVLTRKGTAARYQRDTGELIARQSLGVTQVAAAQLDRATHRAVLTDGNVLQVWELLSGRLVRQLDPPQPITAVAIADGGKLIAAASADERIRLFDAENGAALGTLEAPGGPLSVLRFSPDHRRLLSGGAGQPARLWELRTQRSTELPANSSHKQIALAFSSDGERALVGSAHGIITLWDLASSQPLIFLRTRHSLLRTAALSPDGRLILSGGHEGAVRLFTIDKAELWQRSCQTLSATTRPEDDTRELWAQARAACASTPSP